jgi:hypothetical protein
MKKGDIVNLVTNSLVGKPCVICGEKLDIGLVFVALDNLPVGICGKCQVSGQGDLDISIDEMIDTVERRAEIEIRRLRDLKGKLMVPSFEELLAEGKALEKGP